MVLSAERRHIDILIGTYRSCRGRDKAEVEVLVLKIELFLNFWERVRDRFDGTYR